MTRRELFRIIGTGAVSLTGLNRLVKAMVTPERIVICPILLAGSEFRCDDYSCSPAFHCGDDEIAFECTVEFTCGNHVCNPTDGDFTCGNSYTGCLNDKDFSCTGVDPGADNYQFNCSNAFNGCAGETSDFRCDDFICRGDYWCGVNSRENRCNYFRCELPNPYQA